MLFRYLEAVRDIEHGTARCIEQNESCATWEPSWDRPRLERRDLLALCGPVSNLDTIPPECVGCIRDCNWCTYNIADPENYHRR